MTLDTRAVNGVSPGRHRRSYSQVLAMTVAGVVAIAAAWSLRTDLLRAAAHMWIVSDPVAPADAVVILGGGLDTRPFAAAELFKRGLAKQILVPNVKLARVERLGIVPRHSDLNREVLRRLGIPAESIVEFGESVSSTYEEVRALAAWAKSTGATSLIVPTDLFPTRRVGWLLRHELPDIRVHVQALDSPEYTANNWWSHEQGLISFQNEVVKYLYYRLKY